ncbi:hypothetical protein XELAEV_18025144mg [Xenopus laevis]|uniref:Cadherin domain-containing protein n=1 Tax=Xenopus laevis TaxID=8355 RepID=A0A974D166_XENLA|nr:hypothetical protein XELAEV_18025144mg [Xenopus laevis]
MLVTVDGLLHRRLTVRVTDGYNTADGVLKVQIIPVNDEHPELKEGLKTDIKCQEGSSVTITSENLYANDPDSEDTKHILLLVSQCLD